MSASGNEVSVALDSVSFCGCGHVRTNHAKTATASGYPCLALDGACPCASYQWRDPRRDPVKGDVLGYDLAGMKRRRVVDVVRRERVSASYVVYSTSVNGPNGRPTLTCGLASWRAWAVGATTYARGEHVRARGRAGT